MVCYFWILENTLATGIPYDIMDQIASGSLLPHGYRCPLDQISSRLAKFTATATNNNSSSNNSKNRTWTGAVEFQKSGLLGAQLGQNVVLIIVSHSLLNYIIPLYSSKINCFDILT